MYIENSGFNFLCCFGFVSIFESNFKKLVFFHWRNFSKRDFYFNFVSHDMVNDLIS